MIRKPTNRFLSCQNSLNPKPLNMDETVHSGTSKKYPKPDDCMVEELGNKSAFGNGYLWHFNCLSPLYTAATA